ncbi:fatty acid synthase [Tribolium castaneum]|uniref:Uncharacterized protein n=1 Tax=Tribolium castaneum TaxID=7070 RepID=D6WBV1_TRICA|nr:PREDICTED: fatty acid synthase [Tribolium castaneum]EEZ97866.2 hypothetical protein TcasGA2_TC000238 [Tribolium castaneum]|eukprot:XP_008190356.1 PREDICTED: fatty acid synthase [Tribolium castaneum]
MHFVKDDVVISGIGGYFPKALNIEKLQEHLLNNENLLESRWKAGERGVSNKIGVVPTEYFDNAYFGIHRQQCTFMDPMHRLILERTYEALIDAGVNPSEVRGKRIGCFMASSLGENDNLFLESVVSGFGVTGHSRAMMPNRVSYWLDLKGPSVAYDSNWIGGIEVVRLAYEAIKTGQCEAVLVGTANLALNSEFQWLYNDMGLLSADGSTRAYDIDAQGYARSDGVVVLYIQRASDAKRSYASIVNVATQFDGNREGTLLDIDSNNMAEFISDFYKDIDVDPKDVEFVETYGSALKETDRKELEALEKVYCKNRQNPLLIGTVKPNTGHSEASAALFSIVKVCIAMEAETIPATIQYQTPNPELKPLLNGSMEVVTQNRKWGVKYAAVNAIGLDSYYGHLLLKANPKKKVNAQVQDDIPRLILASTRTEAGIKEILQTIKSRATIDPEYVKLIQDLYSKPILGHLYRGYTILGAEAPKEETEYHLGNKRQIWFVYSGMGSQWSGMASDLMKLPVFANAIHKCHKVLVDKGINLLEIITSKDKTMFDNILHSFVGIAAIQIALTDVLRAVGIVPDGIIGHSVGELGCAYADNCMTAEQMILSAYSRGRASLEATLIRGMMAAIGMGYQQIKDKCPPSIEVACHNGPDSSTISGPTEDMEKFVKELQDQGIFARLVNVSNIAYHSRYIKPAAPGLLKYLKEVLPEPVARSSKWISTSNPEENWETELAKHSSAEYHTNNLLSSVLFEEGLKHIPKDSVLIEIAPHGLLQAILKRSVKSGCTNVSLTQRGSNSGVEFLLSAFGKLYLAGLDMDISKLFPPVEYPVSRGTPCLANLSHWEHSEVWRTGLEEKLKSLFGVRDYQVTLNSEEFRECVGHQLDDKIILPCTSYLSTIFDIVANISTGHKEFIFENLHFKKMLTVPRIGSVALHAMIQKGSGDFEIIAGNDILVTGTLTFPNPADKFMIDPIKVEVSDDNVRLSGTDVYNEFQHRGHKYSGQYKSIKSLVVCENGSVSLAQWNNKWTMFVEAMIQQHLFQDGERSQQIYVPKNIHKIVVNKELLPNDKTDLEVHYDFATGLITCDGIQVVGLKAVPFPKDPKAISFDSIEFTPFNLSNLSIENGINLALQLTLDNFSEQFVTTISINEIEGKNPPLLENIQNVCSMYSKLNSTVTSVKDPQTIDLQVSYPFFVVLNDTINDEVAKLTSSSHGFLLVRSSKQILAYPQIAQVAQFSVNGVEYSILRRAKTTQPLIVTVKGDTLSIKDLTRTSASWVNELDTAAEAAKAKKNSVYLVSSLVPTEGMRNFVEELLSTPKMSNVRVLFALDRRIGNVNVKDPQLQEIFKLDLVLTVIKDGTLGSVLPVPLKLKTNIQNNFGITSNAIKDKVINYVGINLKDETILPVSEKKKELGNIDYSGVGTNGQKVMGLAQLDTDLCQLVPDSILSWNVPDKWSLEEAATIPHAYVSAYYCLFEKAWLKSGEIVLVHAGCTAIGLAAISIAASYDCKIYTTVATEWQRSFLKKQFDCLKDENIFSLEDSSFEPLILMATGGVGAHVIINCLSGHLLQSSVGCLAEYGRLIQIGQHDCEENNTIGMSVFLKNTSFFVVKLENIFLESNEVKQEIRDMVQKGIESKTVRPINRKVVEHYNIVEILNSLSQSGNVGKILIKINNNLLMNKFILNNPSQFICDSKSSYLIYGGSAEQWTDAVEWLVFRGARKIVVSSDSKPQQVYVNRRLSLLQSCYSADIIYAPPKAHTKEGATELLTEVYHLGPIHCVFSLPVKSNDSRISKIKPIQYIDNALRTIAPKAILINFVNHAAGICQFRTEANFPSYHIQWHKDLDFGEIIYGLDEILTYNVRDILIKNDRVSDSHQETTQSLFKKLTLILPNSLEDFIEETKSAPAKPQLIQLRTLGPREIRELAPVFIIPGLSGFKEMNEMAFQLLYPTFCAVLPSTPMPIKELALDLVEQIKKVWPKGAYNIIGVSWGGALMVEIAKILDKQGASLHLYFIDAAPTTLQAAVKHLGESATSIETNLLTRVLKINDAEVVRKIEEAPGWDSRIKLALDHFEGHLSDKKALGQGLFTLKSHLQNLLTFSPSEELVSGQIHLIRPTGTSKYDNCGLVSYCKQTPQITLVNGDHLSIINSPVTTEYINEKHYLI